MDKCKGGYEKILVIVNHFTRFAQAYATTSKSAKTVADRLLNNFALKFEFPSKIHHDQGGEFENQLLTQLKKYSGVAGSRTTLLLLGILGFLFLSNVDGKNVPFLSFEQLIKSC